MRSHNEMPTINIQGWVKERRTDVLVNVEANREKIKLKIRNRKTIQVILV